MTIPGRHAVPAALLAAALTLAGCGGSDDPEPTSGALAPSTAPSAFPSPSATVRVDERNGSLEIEGLGGSVSTGSRLPEGFPAQEIPVVDGDIRSGSRGKAGGPYAYSVIVRVRGTSATEVMAGITAQLTGVGFTAAASPGTDTISASSFSGPRYDVGVNVIRAEGTTTVTYVVVRKG